ncbi:MAG: TetR family transcriptional regulator [Rhizobiaceae bacterium]|nr:TetR family transcriptional regulator [Rhizobiaceae bacterium]
MSEENLSGAPASGLRERKKQETLRRITEAGLKLFSTDGYEATTLDAIAAEAGISRRTFFHYFKSKDDILLSLQRGLGETLAAAVLAQPAGKSPVETVRDAQLTLVAPYSPRELLALDRLMRSSEAVQARKQAGYVHDEALLYDALRKRWPERSETALRLVAMLSIGIVRLSLDVWSSSGGERPLAEHLKEAFDALPAACDA